MINEVFTVAAVSNRLAQAEAGAWRLKTAATYRVTKMKSVKTKDANLWATKTMAAPKYPLELFLRVDIPRAGDCAVTA